MTASERSEQMRTEGVLAGLNTSAVSGFYWYLAMLACIGGFLFGYDTAVIGSVLSFVPYHLSNLATGYLVAGASLGAAIGAIAAGPLTDRFGRKSLLMADASIYAVGAILSAVTINAGMLLGARTLIGLAVGADSAIATAYIAEFAPAKRRGQLGIIQQWMITVGILVSFLIALLVFNIAPTASKGADWRVILGLGAIPAVVAIALRSRMPESPRWLLHKGRYADTVKALGQLGVHVSESDARDTARRLEADAARQSQQRRRVWSPGVKRALIVVSLFFVFQQITGINVPFYYGPKLLADVFKAPGASTLDAAMAGLEAAAVLGLVNVIATFFAFRYIDRAGRRPLAIGGYIGMAIFMVVASIGVAFMTGAPKILVVMIGFSLFITSFAIGVGGTGWLIQGEVFPTAVRGTAASIGASVDWLANFVVIVAFPALTAAMGLSWVMVLLAGLSVVAVAFVTRFLPETKHLTVEEVVAVFEDQSRSPSHRASVQTS